MTVQTALVGVVESQEKRRVREQGMGTGSGNRAEGLNVLEVDAEVAGTFLSARRWPINHQD